MHLNATCNLYQQICTLLTAYLWIVYNTVYSVLEVSLANMQFRYEVGRLLANTLIDFCLLNCPKKQLEYIKMNHIIVIITSQM